MENSRFGDFIQDFQDTDLGQWVNAYSDNAQNSAAYNAVKIANMRDSQQNYNKLFNTLRMVLVLIAFALVATLIIKTFKKN